MKGPQRHLAEIFRTGGERTGVGPGSEEVLLTLPQGLYAKYQTLADFINTHANDGGAVSPDTLMSSALLSYLEGVLYEGEIPGL